ncbi:MAG TPA: STAS domain-containing protein [Pirellulaceae bacterium]|nr:STAS domain-containing protein [Pirellulaceae bacterium]HMO93265.1 STAS domain-containing protein [Pirellulaceae bacterium]HMP69130.1 STAS domain-containing protein [Pirellulaceae bacterium]
MSEFECIDVRDASEVSIVRLVDEKVMDPQRVQKLGEELLTLPKIKPGRILINMSNVKFLSSAAINKLLILEKRLSKQGGRIKFSNLRPEVQEVFNITNLNSVFDICEAEEDAIEELRSNT